MNRYLEYAIYALVAAITGAAIMSHAFAADTRSVDSSFGKMEIVDNGSVVNWSGFYIGGQVGYSTTILGDEDGAGGIALEGAEAGVRAGYDAAFGRFVVGVYGEFNFSSAELELGGITLLEKDNEWSACGRAGVVAAPRTLIYGLACYTQLEFASPLVNGDIDPFDGFKAGIGGQLKTEDGINLGLEITYTWADEDDRLPAGVSINDLRVMFPVTFSLGGLSR